MNCVRAECEWSRAVSAAPTKRKPEPRLGAFAAETLYLYPLGMGLLVRGFWLCLRRSIVLADIIGRVLTQGSEPPARRLRALLHTLLGACYALQLRDRGVDHIHVHHGYFASWIAMVAARLLDIRYSVTLHGSDLLLHGVYLDTKLKHCSFCVTVSEFNRRFLLEHYPEVEPEKILVQRLGVDASCTAMSAARPERKTKCLNILAVGRLHPVKDHAFLLRACHELKGCGMEFSCLVAGEGPERPWLEHLIRNLGLDGHVKLLGHLCRQRTRCPVRVVRLGRSHQPQRRHPAGADGSDGARQDCVGSRDHRNSGTGKGRRDRFPVSRRFAGRLHRQGRNHSPITHGAAQRARRSPSTSSRTL